MKTSSNKKKVFFTSISLAILFIAGTNIFSLIPDIDPKIDAFAVTDVDQKDNAIVKELEGVKIAASAITSNDNGTITLPMKITNDENVPLTHVDWLIKVQDPEGKEVFKSSTLHS
ncbi:MAG: hypothetical protein H0U27_09555, partial [Nitrosopumilus sp.]|nr:hypothetical protein [Nitrosopumilus sp.]